MRTLKIALVQLLLMSAFLGTALADAKRVLIVHSAHPGFAWVQGINYAIKARFEKSGIDYQFFYMNTHINNSVSSKKKICLKALQLMNRFNPQVVIAVDDDAQKYFVKPMLGKTNAQFVFCGVNANPELYGYPSDNVTGILERTYPKQTLQLLKMIYPNANTAVCISDDSSNSNLVIPRLKHYAAGKMPVKLNGFIQPTSFSQWVKAVERYNQDQDVDAFLIPFTNTVKQDWDGENMSPAEIMMWTNDNATKPIVGLWPSAADNGALCAVVVDPKEHGTVAALMAKKILAGKKAGQIPMVTNQDGYVIVNLKTAAKLNIDVPFSVLQSVDKIIE